MSRRFSMTSNPVRASESQDEAEPLLGDAEEKCDVVVEAIGFGNWAIGTLYTVGAAWITLPVWSWRSLAVACALPPLAVAIALLFVLNESPRWLLEEGRREEAATVLRQLAKRNNKTDDKAVDTAISKVAEGGDDASVARGFDVATAWRNFTSLFDERRRWMTAAVWMVWFAFGLLYYGITLLVTRSYNLCGNQ